MEHEANDLLTEAKQILAAKNSVDKPARDFMTAAQRDALADDFASRKQFLSASHFHSDAVFDAAVIEVDFDGAVGSLRDEAVEMITVA